MMGRITFIPINEAAPCIRGMRIRVKDVLDLLAAGVSEARFSPIIPDLEAKTYAHRSPMRAEESDHDRSIAPIAWVNRR